MRRSTISKLRLRTDAGFEAWAILVLGTVGLLGIAGLLIMFLLAGSVTMSILSGAVLLYVVWGTYDTFVVKECWTLYLEEVK